MKIKVGCVLVAPCTAPRRRLATPASYLKSGGSGHPSSPFLLVSALTFGRLHPKSGIVDMNTWYNVNCSFLLGPISPVSFGFNEPGDPTQRFLTVFPPAETLPLMMTSLRFLLPPGTTSLYTVCPGSVYLGRSISGGATNSRRPRAGLPVQIHVRRPQPAGRYPSGRSVQRGDDPGD